MTKETKERIAYYKSAIPQAREKLVGAVFMFLIAIITTVSATYAWITLSTSPEVTSVDTTVTANGSLEIALANGTGDAPGKSAAGDSTGAGKAVTSANITWGNLVNLSDPSYGLKNVILRPAALKGTTGLLSNPLYGVGYGEDGRVSNAVTDDDFAYVYYDTSSSKFLVDMQGNHLGVRAISTVQYENLDGDNTLAELLRYTNQNLTLAKNNYQTMMNEKAEPGKSYITSLQGLIQVYAQNVLDKKSPSQLDVTKYVQNLYEMMVYFNDNVIQPSGESYVQMANMLELMKGSGSADAGYTVDTLVSAYKSNKLPSYIKDNISSLGTYAEDYAQIRNYLKTSAKGDYSDFTQSQKNSSLAYWAYYANHGGTVYWSNIDAIINWVCKINTATLDGYTLSQLANISIAIKILGQSNHKAVINDGAIYRMEKRISVHMSPTITVTVDASSISSLVGKKTMKAVLTTSASDPYEMETDIDAVKKLNTGSFRGDTATAEDTYALAVDLWLRTNAGSSSSVTATTETEGNMTTVTSPEQAYLTLEGSVITGTEEAQTTMKDANGEERDAYTATFVLEGSQTSMDVFERYGSYYFIDENNEEVNLETYLTEENGGTLPDVTYTKKMTQQQVVVGYEGPNRVWNTEQMAGYIDGGTSTTQGGGSCYVFYADDPADQSRFLELLESMRVVFIDGKGKQIGAATMDTQNYFAENGKVTVPLVLDKNQAINLGDNGEGKTVYGLMALTKNAATRVTALVYLDGTKLTNQMVLASGDIQGNLNIQFGSYTASKVEKTTTDTDGTTNTDESYIHGKDNESIKDDSLMDDKIAVSASVTSSQFTYNPSNPAKTTLNVKVDGVTPNSVSARFIRAISSTQGVQQDEVALDGSGDSWSKEFTFSRPGNYVLRTVWVDGSEYDLENPITVTVTGASVNSLTCDAIPAGSSRATIMTADGSVSTNLTLGFTSSAQIPSRVNGLFMDENGRQVNVPFSLKAGTWTGTATFNTSGTYTMKYVEIDGDTYELSESLQPTLELLLGLKVNTTISASQETLNKLQAVNPTAMPTKFVLDPGKLPDGVTLNVAVKVYDNNGNELPGLSGIELYYGRVGSSILSRGLYSTLRWSADAESYIGSFLVTQAGTFSFNKVVVKTGEKTNTITAKTSAPNIQAIPPEDASYFNNYTDTYQYSPLRNAAMTIGVAYSSAASKIEATLKNGATTVTVEGTMGREADDQGDKTVNLWSFKVPEINESQEGEWTLTDITLYGVYYGGQYYDEIGAKIDLSGENIHSKVVNYVYTTLSGSSQNFNGYFMDDHKVDDMTVTIADYEGEPIQGHTISNLKVLYKLNAAKVSANTYGYTADNIASVAVEGQIAQATGSQTEYKITNMNFQQAGPYDSCSISFDLDGTPVNVGNGSYKVRYMDNGTASEQCPKYDVTWIAPTITVTGVSPNTSKDLQLGASDYKTNDTVRNYYDEHSATVYTHYDSSFFGKNLAKLSEITLKLTNAGSKLSKALLSYSWTSSGEEWTNSWDFSGNNSSVTSEVGAGDTSIFGAYGSRRDITGTVTSVAEGTIKPNYSFGNGLVISAIQMIYNGQNYAVYLADNEKLTIRQTSTAFPAKITYESNPDYPEISVSGLQSVGGTGHPVKLELPRVDQKVVREVVDDKGTNVTGSSTSNTTIYYLASDDIEELEKVSASRGATQTNTQTFDSYNRTILTEQLTTSRDYYNATYEVDGWTIYTASRKQNDISWTNPKFYAAGTVFTGTGEYKAVPHLKEVSREKTSSTTVEQQRITTTDKLNTKAADSRTRTRKATLGWGWKWGSWSGFNKNVSYVTTLYTTPHVEITDK